MTSMATSDDSSHRPHRHNVKTLTVTLTRSHYVQTHLQTWLQPSRAFNCYSDRSRAIVKTSFDFNPTNNMRLVTLIEGEG